MALRIIETCINCWACQPLCPTQAIYLGPLHFVIEEDQCHECEGDYADPQCASICPIEGAIVNSRGEALNPPGSLTGIAAPATQE